MTRSPLLCCTSIIRSSPLVQASSSLSMICARTWPTVATRQRNPFPPFFARVSNYSQKFAYSNNLNFWSTDHFLCSTARSLEDETREVERNANSKIEILGDFSQLQIQIKQKSQFEFVPCDTSEFKSNQNLNSTLYREIPRNLIYSILTS